jgi:hypothetical protein
MRYFFDSRDNDTFLRDAEGLVFPNLDTVKLEAARALAEIAKDILPGSVRRVLAIEVRDEHGRPILITSLVFEVVVLIADLRLAPRVARPYSSESGQ